MPSTSRAQSQVPTFDAFYVFGDSLADTGNVWLTSKLLGARPAPPPSESPNLTYSRGRFSNGPVAFEYLWDRLRQGTSLGPLRPYVDVAITHDGSRAVNFAFGGTGTPLLDQTPAGLWAPGLLGQVELFNANLAGGRPSKNALYAIVSGANDYRVDAYNTPMSPVAVVANIVTAVKRLRKIGARDILVLTLPNLGCTPSAGAPATCVENATPQIPTADASSSSAPRQIDSASRTATSATDPTNRIPGIVRRVVGCHSVIRSVTRPFDDNPMA